MAAYENRYWWSRDGLRLHYRDYPGRDAVADGRPPIVCLPGLTRNARDFEALADRLAGEWRVIAVDLRGRGESAYAKDAMTYTPLTYVQDIEARQRVVSGKSVYVRVDLGGSQHIKQKHTHTQRTQPINKTINQHKTI